jgi:uncharacterized protein YyaL (SSP411 family)
VSTVAADVRAHLAGTAGLTGEGDLGEEVLAGAVDTLSGDFDRRSAGFGAAPKFPPSMTLEFLLRHQARTGSVLAGEMVDATCHAMARGGMYDQVGGGFARYSVDRDWVVPHFEKMLYDNEQLLGLYARWWRQGGDPLGARVARETADFLLAELRTPEGGLASALDADSEGVEGRFYAWTPDQLVEVLGPDDGAWAAALLDVTPRGTFEHGTSTLQLRQDPDDPERWASVRSRLAQARAERVRPARDDKVVAAWNGLAVASLAEAGRLLDEPRYVDAAVETAELLLDVHLHDGRLRRVSRDGVAGRHAGVLEDYACVAHGFLALVSATGDGRWLRHAGVLLDAALDRFPAGDGGFHDTAEDAETRGTPRDPSDNASPSGTVALVHALLGYAALTGSSRHRRRGGRWDREGLAERVPRSRLVAGAAGGQPGGAAEVAGRGPRRATRCGTSWRRLRGGRSRPGGGRRRSSGRCGRGGRGGADAVPLLEHRDLLDGHAAAYVCRRMVCERPVGTVDELRALLAR